MVRKQNRRRAEQRKEAVNTAIQPQLEKKKATFNLDADLHHRLKIAAATHRREMVEIVEEALEDYLKALEKVKAG